MHALAAEPQTHIADAIRRRMQKSGLTQKALALKAGLNETYVRDILYGRSKNPRHEGLVAIATALNCSILDLIDPELAAKPVMESEVVDKPEERALLAYFRAHTPADRERLLIDMLRAGRKGDDV
jgi:transcriptional regulator with XRE-family HTH domain